MSSPIHSLPPGAARVLVCFAVREEAVFFRGAAVPPGVVTCVTGMGARNAATGVRRAFAAERPDWVVTAGFAGGLDPAWATGAVAFDADPELVDLAARLRMAGARTGRLVCTERVAVTVAEKLELRRATGAELVEMESAVIRAFCREQGVPSATVRVVSDPAGEDLPLDFNALMTPDARISLPRLALAVARSPGRIPRLLQFQRQTAAAAQNLARTLAAALTGGGVGDSHGRRA